MATPYNLSIPEQSDEQRRNQVLTDTWNADRDAGGMRPNTMERAAAAPPPVIATPDDGPALLPNPGSGFVRGTPTNPPAAPRAPWEAQDVVGKIGNLASSIYSAFTGPSGQGAQAAPAGAPAPVFAAPSPTPAVALSPPGPNRGATPPPADVPLPPSAPVAGPLAAATQAPGYPGAPAPLPAQGPIYNTPNVAPGPELTAAQMNAPFAAQNRQFDDRKAAEAAAQFQMMDYLARLQEAQTARMSPRGGDRVGTEQVAQVARNAANPLPAPLDAAGVIAKSMQAQGESGQRENRAALVPGEISKMTAEAGLNRAQAGEVTERTKGYALDRAGKLLDQEGKAVDLKLLGQKFDAGKMDLQHKEILNTLLGQLAVAKDPQEIARIQAAIRTSLGKNGEQWKFGKTGGGQEPIDPAQPALGSRTVPEVGFLYNEDTGKIIRADDAAPAPPKVRPSVTGDTRVAPNGTVERFDGKAWVKR